MNPVYDAFKVNYIGGCTATCEYGDTCTEPLSITASTYAPFLYMDGTNLKIQRHHLYGFLKPAICVKCTSN